MPHRQSQLVHLISFLVLSLSALSVFAQNPDARKTVAISGGMGVSYIHASDLIDYMNQFTTANNKVSDFKSAVEFFAAPEISLSSDLGLKVEYAYLLTSYNFSQPSSGSYNFDYAIHMPTALVFYVIEGEHYFVKLGGGMGYHFGKFTELSPNSGRESRYTSSGVGFKIELMGNTAFGESLYGVIGGDLRLDFIGTLKDSDGRGLQIRRAYGPIDPVKLRFISAGIKFGLMYYF